jgi:hypothetical protein
MPDGEGDGGGSVVSGAQGAGGTRIAGSHFGGGGASVMGGGGMRSGASVMGGGGPHMSGSASVMGGALTMRLGTLRTGSVAGGLAHAASTQAGGGGAAGPTVSSVPAPAVEDKEIAGVSEGVKGEFKSALHRFAVVVSHTIQQVRFARCQAPAPSCHTLQHHHHRFPAPSLQLSGDVLLSIPDVDLSDLAAAAQDEGIKAVLVEAVEAWTRVIQSVTGTVSDKDKGTRPLHEVEFWRNRNATLSTMYEQLNNARVRPILEALQLAQEPSREAFRVQFGELSKAYVQARDNVKFLNTLERHFKALATGSLSVMLDTLPSLMNGGCARARAAFVLGVFWYLAVECHMLEPHAPPIPPSCRPAHGLGHLAPLQHGRPDAPPHAPHRPRDRRQGHERGVNQADPPPRAHEPRRGDHGHDAGEGRP